MRVGSVDFQSNCVLREGAAAQNKGHLTRYGYGWNGFGAGLTADVQKKTSASSAPLWIENPRRCP
jgi:hypothetical protein